VENRDDARQREPFIALQVQDGCEAARQHGATIGWPQSTSQINGSHRDVGAGPASHDKHQSRCRKSQPSVSVVKRYSDSNSCYRCAESGSAGRAFGGPMRKPRPVTYNPAQVLHLINSDRHGVPLSCPCCSGMIDRDPPQYPPAPLSHVTLKCRGCGRTAKYIASAAGAA
jgi:hypothetical protein